jgi:SAM-dependent methyltransferase
MQSIHCNTSEAKSFAEILEEEWVVQSEALEEKHFDAAFEAKVAEIDIESPSSSELDNNSNVPALHRQPHLSCQGNASSHTKSKCYSPYVPSNALRIQGMIDLIQFRPTDIFCDMGCGDGRVCFVVAAAQYLQQQQKQQQCDNGSNDNCESSNKFCAIGIDISKDCIDVAKQHLASNRHLSDDVKQCIQFYQADLTIHPNDLLRGTASLIVSSVPVSFCVIRRCSLFISIQILNRFLL